LRAGQAGASLRLLACGLVSKGNFPLRSCSATAPSRPIASVPPALIERSSDSGGRGHYTPSLNLEYCFIEQVEFLTETSGSFFLNC